MYPAQYWRENKKWKNWLGKQGVVLACTTVHTAAPEYHAISPYQLALVDFNTEKKLFMVPPAHNIATGEKVEVVLRKGGHTSLESIIEYQLKVVPISQ